MKYTFDLPEKTKRKLEEIKHKLKRENIRAFEQHIVDYLIKHADINVLRIHFGELARRREREKAPPLKTRHRRKRKRTGT